MTAVKLNLPPIEKGATYSHVVYWRAADKTTAINLTNCTAKMQIRPTVDSSVLLGELSTANGRIIITGSTGKIELAIPSTDTTGLVATKDAVYDLEVYYPAKTVRLIEGKVTIKEEVTRG
jgi:hypothetical protein